MGIATWVFEQSEQQKTLGRNARVAQKHGKKRVTEEPGHCCVNFFGFN